MGVDLGRRFWSRALCDVGYETRESSAWLIEGLLYYLTEAAVYAFLSAVSALAATRSRIGADLVSRDLLTSPKMGPLLGAFAQRSVVGRFGTNDPEGLCSLGTAGRQKWPGPANQEQTMDGGPTRLYFGAPDVPRRFLVRGWRV